MTIRISLTYKALEFITAVESFMVQASGHISHILTYKIDNIIKYIDNDDDDNINNNSNNNNGGNNNNNIF